MSAATTKSGQVDSARYVLRARLRTIHRASLYVSGASALLILLPNGPVFLLSCLSIASSLAGIAALCWLFALDRNRV